jgi:hypothetical protein
LRYRLLRQPGGFEGLALIQADLAFEQLAVPKLPESADLPAYGRAASRAAPNESIRAFAFTPAAIIKLPRRITRSSGAIFVLKVVSRR